MTNIGFSPGCLRGLVGGWWGPQETVARRRSAALLSEFGLSHVREYAPLGFILSALHLILRAKSQHI